VNLRVKSAIGVVGLLVAVACGRTRDEGGDPQGGAGSEPGAGGQSPAAGSGGKLDAGGSGKGESQATGGLAGTGGSTVSDGHAGEGGAEGDSIPLAESSWNTSLALTVTKSAGIVNINCAATGFTLHVSPSGSNLKAIIGGVGFVQPGELIGDSAGAPTYSVSRALPVPASSECDLESIELTQLALRASDADGDGTADRIGGRGKANGRVVVGDQGFTAELSFTLEGVPDTTQPTLVAPSNPHPLDSVLLRTTEPIALTSSVTLTSTGTTSADQPLSGYTAGNGAFGYFSTPVILPFGSSWKVSATGGDLANLPFDIEALPPIAVLADPGLFAQDGFENTPALTLGGDAKIVTSVGTMGAITGNKSLFVPPDASASLHLARASGTSSVRFTVQSLMNDSGTTVSGLLAEAGVIGGSVRVRYDQPIMSTPSTDTSDNTWKYAGPKQEVTLGLTESGSDVVIRFATPVCRGLCPPARALLIDDLRVE